MAVKNGKELFFASLYFRSRQGVNNYARVHHVTPVDQRSATIRERSAGTTDKTFTARDWVLWDYAINDPGVQELDGTGVHADSRFHRVRHHHGQPHRQVALRR